MVLEKVENENKSFRSKDEEPSIIKREKKTVEFMLQIYCGGNHKTRGALCLECQEFLDYIKNRLDNCPYGENKTACGRCGLTCYAPERKEKGVAVFTYSGPRMLVRHPILAFKHFLDGFREPKKLDS